MIELLKAALLGLVQGLTEFLPISSSGHLALLKKLAFFQVFSDPHLDKMFDVALHGGTLVALLIYFRRDLARLGKDQVYRRLVTPILIGTVIVLGFGKVMENPIEQKLNLSLLIAVLLIVFGLLLWVADARGKKAREFAQVSRWDVILMTLSQMIALIPGVSRSGITMTTGLWQGMTREAAVRLSFLLSIPVVAAPPAYFALQLARHKETLPAGGLDMVVVGVLAAAVSGYAAIGGLLKFVQSRSLTPFVIYRVLLGVAVIGLVASGVMQG